MLFLLELDGDEVDSGVDGERELGLFAGFPDEYLYNFNKLFGQVDIYF